MSTISSWLASLPRNTTASIQRLTPYGWLRLLLIIAAYLFIRPYLMRLAERGQRRAHDQVLEMHPQVPRPVREGGGEDGDGQMGEATGSEKGGMGEEAGVKGRKRTIKGLAEVRMEGGAEGEEEGDDDEAFLRKYCGVRAL